MVHEQKQEVAAGADAVWRVIQDVERWPEWTPTMRSVKWTNTNSAPLAVGSEARVHQPGLAPATWRVTAVEPGRSFVWESTVLGVTTVAEHEVLPAGSGSTLVLRLRQRGALAGVVGALYGRKTRRYLSQEANGLGLAAEAASR